jgi:hypothetical protein
LPLRFVGALRLLTFSARIFGAQPELIDLSEI